MYALDEMDAFKYIQYLPRMHVQLDFLNAMLMHYTYFFDTELQSNQAKMHRAVTCTRVIRCMSIIVKELRADHDMGAKCMYVCLNVATLTASHWQSDSADVEISVALKAADCQAGS